MLVFEWIVGVLVGAVLLAAVARRLGAPFPAFLALGGVVLAFVPQVPNLRLDPDLALALFLAPILLDAGYDTSLRDLRENWRPIAGLVVGAVGVTTVAVALVVRWFVPDMPLAACIVLGAIVAPPDAVAALSVLSHVRLPHRIVTILKGESLFNDASALMIYRLAVPAAATGAFSVRDVAPTFLVGVAGSLIAGPVLAWLYLRAMRRFGDAPSTIVLQFVSTFGVWLAAERIGLSGVLTVVSFGITVARLAPATVPAHLRVPSNAVWETAVFVLNVLAFVLVGLQVGPILEGLTGEQRGRYALIAAAVFATVVVVRLAWVMGAAGAARLWRRTIGPSGPEPAGLLASTTVAWCGMRGVVTIALALALPEGADAFPYRDLVVLTAFCVVLGTLVIQGLTLRPLLAWFSLGDDDPVGREVGRARAEAYRAARDSIAQDRSPHAEALRREFTAALREAEAHSEGRAPASLPADAPRLRAVGAARSTILALRERGEIGDDAFYRLEEELDWTELSATPRDEIGQT
ncbi:Sodium, potassium, lithium and rubidium/H(+) antiporter [Methylobacterium crusticola]|uniref:Sodium, potassium, lithium and rubidium/H(+) antiporter n=1 Tax=Methylobacterium crusticola TaxID=1697972 RepID=A0ABQ4QUJ7_9HYPH|nr:Na+/H+ antiporter [Methylobacterium crusticola]GJD49003.1 Sodium, potassium, lithium and rubidium/H(+) antiporter [Methylobacterium crusticola]